MHLSTNFSMVCSVFVLLCACTTSPTSPKDSELPSDIIIVDDGGVSSDADIIETLVDLAVTDEKDVGSDAHMNETTAFQVTVTNGFGSGTYDAGTTVHIWASHNPKTQVVTRWSGDSDVLIDVGEWHTSFVMPSLALSRMPSPDAVRRSGRTPRSSQSLGYGEFSKSFCEEPAASYST